MIENDESDSKFNNNDKKILFVTNVPSYLNEQHVKSVFSCFGKINHIIFNLKPTKKNLLQSQSSKSDKLYFKKVGGGGEEELNEFVVDVSGSGFKHAYVLFDETISIEKAMEKKLNWDPKKCINLTSQITNTGFKSK